MSNIFFFVTTHHRETKGIFLVNGTQCEYIFITTGLGLQCYFTTGLITLD